VLYENRVHFIAGMLSAFTLGDAKPTADDHTFFADVARDALSRAHTRRRSQ
jgi:hypothetical protein